MNSGSLAALTQHRFTRDDKGGITMFVVVLFVVMAVVAGGAIDLARHETARADLQNALDRGVLAAANWNSDVPDNAAAQSVVQGYMASRQQRGTPYQLQVNNTPAATGRAISASASLDIDTIFLTAMGLDQLDVPASAGAAQTVGLTEVVLVLDVSGSMGWDSSWNDGQSKLDDLKFAAKQFIDTVLAGSSADRTLISIVPYSAQVTLPASMAAQYNLNTHHNYSYCVDYDDLDYATLGISLDASLEQHEHYATYVEEYEVEVTTLEAVPVEREVTREETYTATENVIVGYFWWWYRYWPIWDTVEVQRTRTVTDIVIDYEEVEVTRVETRRRGIFGCPGDNNAIVPYSNDPEALKTAIDGMSPQNFTAASVGMTWAAALLDPGTAPLVDTKIAAGDLPEYFDGWPRAWSNTQGRKIVVLMTDGVNTRQERPSNIDYARVGADGFNDLDNYDYDQWGNLDKSGELDIYTILNDAASDQQTTLQMADGTSLRHGPIDRNLFQVCDALKSAGSEGNRPIIYTIGFELGSGTSDAAHADQVLRHCATHPTNHYMVEGISIIDAFANIANELKTLKLVN